MGAAESAEAEADGPGVATGLLKLKLQRSKGEISEEQYDAGALANPRAPPPRARPPHPRPALPCPAAHRDAILALYVACLASREPLHTAYQPFISCAVRGRARPVAPWVSAVRPRVTVVCALHGGVCRICRRGQGAAGGRRRERGAGSAQRRRGSTQRRSGSGAGASCPAERCACPSRHRPSPQRLCSSSSARRRSFRERSRTASEGCCGSRSSRGAHQHGDGARAGAGAVRAD
jgi:hypothetical protein